MTSADERNLGKLIENCFFNCRQFLMMHTRLAYVYDVVIMLLESNIDVMITSLERYSDVMIILQKGHSDVTEMT